MPPGAARRCLASIRRVAVSDPAEVGCAALPGRSSDPRGDRLVPVCASLISSILSLWASFSAASLSSALLSACFFISRIAELYSSRARELRHSGHFQSFASAPPAMAQRLRGKIKTPRPSVCTDCSPDCRRVRSGTRRASVRSNRSGDGAAALSLATRLSFGPCGRFAPSPDLRSEIACPPAATWLAGSRAGPGRRSGDSSYGTIPNNF